MNLILDYDAYLLFGDEDWLKWQEAWSRFELLRQDHLWPQRIAEAKRLGYMGFLEWEKMCFRFLPTPHQVMPLSVGSNYCPSADEYLDLARLVERHMATDTLHLETADSQVRLLSTKQRSQVFLSVWTSYTNETVDPDPVDPDNRTCVQQLPVRIAILHCIFRLFFSNKMNESLHFLFTSLYGNAGMSLLTWLQVLSCQLNFLTEAHTCPYPNVWRFAQSSLSYSLTDGYRSSYHPIYFIQDDYWTQDNKPRESLQEKAHHAWHDVQKKMLNGCIRTLSSGKEVGDESDNKKSRKRKEREMGVV
jgi:hypothetical protein